MKPWMVGFGVLCLAGMLAADEPAKPSAPEPKPAAEATVETDVKDLGLSASDLNRLREFGYSDPELVIQIKDNKRTARQLILEHEILEQLSKVIADVSQRVVNQPAEKQAAEREKSLKGAITKIRWERKASKAELREILAKSSFLTEDELKRVVR